MHTNEEGVISDGTLTYFQKEGAANQANLPSTRRFNEILQGIKNSDDHDSHEAYVLYGAFFAGGLFLPECLPGAGGGSKFIKSFILRGEDRVLDVLSNRLLFSV
jgi:hypothetical protein